MAIQLTKYTLDVDMDWSEWPEPQSVLGVWNREMNAFDPLRTQLPTPSASEHTDMSVLPDGSTSMEPENKRIVYVFEPGNDNPPRVFTQEGLKCVFCQSRGIQNSWDQLHFHYLTNHEYFKFTITDEDPRGTEKPAWKVVYIELGDLRPFGRPSNNDRDYRELNWVQPSQPFDLTAYLRGEGDPCWEPSGKVTKPIAKGPGKRRPGYSRQISEKPQRFVPTLKEPELVGDLPSKKRKRFVVPPIKDANGHPVQLFRSISKRSIYPGEELSESDDDVDLNWLKLKQDTRRFPGLSKQAQDFIRLFDDYMEVEHLCGDRFVGDALVRFLKKYAKELGQCSQPCRDKINQLWEDGIITEQTQSWCLDWIAGRNRSDDTASSSRGYPDPPENGIASDKLHRPLVPESETEKGEKSGKQAALSDTPLDTPPPKRRKYMPGGSGGGGRYVEVEGPEEATISASTKPSKDAASVQVNLSADTAAAQQPALQGSKPSSCVCGKDVESARGSVLCANVVSF
ncbi:hypothetical protein H2203_001378 [Taxawa tesnikishii (nom. ined.)]|nr:hypothetical protein H2203_001378 [Dothideales sp. JES 119]